MHNLLAKLSEFSLLRLRIAGAAAKMCLQVRDELLLVSLEVNDKRQDLVSRHDHTQSQCEKPPVAHIDATVRVRLVRRLLDELVVKIPL